MARSLPLPDLVSLDAQLTAQPDLGVRFDALTGRLIWDSCPATAWSLLTLYAGNPSQILALPDLSGKAFTAASGLLQQGQEALERAGTYWGAYPFLAGERKQETEALQKFNACAGKMARSILTTLAATEPHWAFPAAVRLSAITAADELQPHLPAITAAMMFEPGRLRQ